MSAGDGKTVNVPHAWSPVGTTRRDLKEAVVRILDLVRRLRLGVGATVGGGERGGDDREPDGETRERGGWHNATERAPTASPGSGLAPAMVVAP
jgi:hypothetical protein